MNYTNEQLGNQLNEELKKGYDVIRISRWALRIYFSSVRELTVTQKDVIMGLFTMEDDPQFEYSEEQLKLLATMLINNEKDPIKYINNLKQK